MTLKELMLGNIQSNQGAAMMQFGAQTTQKAGNGDKNPVFGEILGSKMNSTDRQGSVKRSGTTPASSRKDTDPLTAKDESKPKFLTFREANDFSTKKVSSAASSEKTVKANDSTDNKTDGLEEDSKKKAAQDNTPNNMIQALAQILGLDMKDLQKLLDKAGITSESLNNPNDLGENGSKLSQLLGLDNEQQGTLLKLFGMAGNVIGNIRTEQEPEANAAKAQDTTMQGKPADDSGLADSAVEVLAQKLDKTAQNPETDQQSSEIEALLAKLNGKIKIRLNELGNELEKDQGSVETSLRQILQPLMDKAAGKMQEPAQTVDGTSGTEVTDGPELTTTAATDTAASKNDGEGQQTQTKSGKETVAQQPVVTVQEAAQPQTVFAVVQPDKAIVTEAVAKAAITKAPVDTKEIISQVIEKAKVILTPDKSEMIMDLKPDSLGKISLKVATENGMVMAKFVAESQQVKQVLEANMQLLKDSLEKQGLTVQGFSVSVGQDSNRPAADNWKQPDGSKGYNTNGTEYPISGINGSLTGTIEAAGRNNPYTWGSSTINLTA